MTILRNNNLITVEEEKEKEDLTLLDCRSKIAYKNILANEGTVVLVANLRINGPFCLRLNHEKKNVLEK
ncbi:MAG: hypothetical protein ACI8RD_013820 [Bacillariaceae sp.]|jgi:hypothetical protein